MGITHLSRDKNTIMKNFWLYYVGFEKLQWYHLDCTSVGMVLSIP